MKMSDMHEDILEDMSKARGYNEGYDAGRKRAWDLLDKLADWYKEQANNPWSTTHDDTREESLAKRNAILYAQMVIKKDHL